MKFVQNIFDQTRPLVEKDGKRNILYPLHNALETMAFVPNHTAHAGAHIRDAIDLKRTMVTVIFAMVPALLFGMWNIGRLHYGAIGLEATLLDNFLFGALKLLPLITVTYAAGLGVEIFFSWKRNHPVNEGFLVSGLLIPLIMPVDIPLWMVAASTIFAVLIGKEVFGGTGMNLLNPALTARAFAFFAYPTWMSGDQVWINTSGGDIVDGYSGATAMGDLATTVGQGLGNPSMETVMAQFGPEGTYSLMNAFLGLIPGSIGETSALLILLGGLFLIFKGVGSWKIMLSFFLGGLVMAGIFNAFAVNEFMGLNPIHQLMLGGFIFGMVFMATDPVSAAQTETGKYIYGFFAGFFGIMIRVFNPAYPEGIMLAILFMNVMAPLIDHYVIEANIKRREKRLSNPKTT
ncbi:MAG TPA: NADH:ubiquinone reductase (Na(+)-transporting) subunit B [Cryomorphaceae bacterium]|nr:NADH:ubiquinone reductase (Na(+)-transporting) subunit B [Cryomorphaceae bacterium]|tara:strand:+ start:487 stop:1698 length:1212 start_codon:yes stop_codon:yes gene_type:complete